ncbi:MAG: hypothetical protein R2800_04095 [Flavipsychrobacter sp.]
MQKTLRSNLLLLLITTTLLSCEKGTDIICKITNNSSEKITVKTYSNYLVPNQVIETIIDKQETKDIYTNSRQIGGFHETTTINNVIDSITAKTETGKTLIKYYNNEGDWTKEIDKKKQTIVFTAIINDITLK